MALYYSGLVVMWCVLWGLAALALGELPDKLRHSIHQRWHPWSVVGVLARIARYERSVLAVTILWFASIHVLAYAPAAKAIAASGAPQAETLTDFYVPVQWLIDVSPLREPLLRWADLSGQRTRFVAESEGRRRANYWGTAAPLMYAAVWLCFGTVCVFGPAWIFRRAVIRLLTRFQIFGSQHSKSQYTPKLTVQARK